jgi:predicted CXXCH cytochrome family protein
MRTDNVATPAAGLLLRATPMELCLSCHDGSKASAPDVITPVSYVADPAAGQFPNTGGTPTTIAHHLNNPTPEVPPGGAIAMVLTCTTCHDPHGNANYRNLRPDPTLTGLPAVSVIANQTVLPNGSNPSAVYVPTNIIYKSGVSLWCENCHGVPLAGSDHPVDRTMFGSAIASYTRWSTGTQTTVTSVGGTPLPRVPAHSPTDDVYPSSDDQVMCLSCHKAHGSSNWKTLIYADGATMDSTCQECHNQ